MHAVVEVGQGVMDSVATHCEPIDFDLLRFDHCSAKRLQCESALQRFGQKWIICRLRGTMHTTTFVSMVYQARVLRG